MLHRDLWSSFHEAKAALFTALLNRDQHPVHVFSAAPSQRHAIRTEVNQMILSLLEVEGELEVIHQEVKRVHEKISEQRAAAEISLQPVGALPAEVIREIVWYTAQGPWARRHILRLSHVSKMWREVVLGISALFIEADWDAWPALLVDTWCSRAGPRLLYVSLERSLRLIFDEPSKSSLYTLIQKRSAQIGRLKVETSPRRFQSINKATSGVLDLQLPSLGYLSVDSWADASPGFHIQQQNMPKLRILDLAKLYPQIVTPLTSVTYLRFHTPTLHTLWHPQTEIFSKFPSLQHLAVDIDNLDDVLDITGHAIVLQSLISLEVLCITPRPVGDMLRFFSAFSLPNIRSLVLHCEYAEEDCTTFLESLV